MNHKITFQELVNAVAEQSGRSKQFTHDFIKDFASLIKEGLEQNDSVNVAGLGTFKLKKMDERDGYNPETEEKITIPAHNKIDFSPYKDLSELVNAPYAHMEPEILDEEVQSSSASEETEDTEDEAGEKSKEDQNTQDTGAGEDNTEKEKAPWEEDMESEIEVDKDDPFGLNAKHKKSTNLPAADEDTAKEDQEERAEEEDEVDSGKEIASDTQDEQNDVTGATEEQDQEQQPKEEEPASVSGAKTKNVTGKPQFRDRSPHRKDAGGTFWIIAAAFIILLLAIGAWYLLGTQQQATPQTAATESSQSQVESETQDRQQTQNTVQPPEQEEQDDTEPVQQQAADNNRVQQQAAASNGTDRNDQKAGAQNSQNAGADAPAPVETITVDAGQTLWGLADNAYQNPYLWPWIYDTNQPEIEDPDLIYAGQMLDIPQRRGQNNQLSNNDSLQVALGYVETYLWYKENNLENARFYLYAAKKYHNRVFEYTDATFDEDDLRFANRAQ